MLTKELVFQIMGKYYGNAYYRSAIEHSISEDDLYLVTKILNMINALGYNFSNLNALKGTEDCRFVPIILKYFQGFNSVNYASELLNAVCYPAYQDYVPQLLVIYESTASSRIKLDISQSLLCIRSKKFISEYLRIINSSAFGIGRDYLIDLLCKLHVKEVIPKLQELLEKNPHEWRWTFLKYAPVFHDPSLIPLIEPYLESTNSELRKLARKAIKSLNHA